MKLIFFLVALPIAVVWSQTTTTPTTTTTGAPKTQFLVVSPFRIRQGQPFNVVVTRSGVIKSITVKVTLTGTLSNGTAILPILRTALISTATTRAAVTFDTTKIENGNYFLTVEGEGYKDTRALTYALKDAVVFVELNRPIFKPGQLVQGRVYAINSETNAVTPRDACSINIRSPDGKVVANYDRIAFTKGKHEFQLQLVDRPPLGQWYILIQCGNNEYVNEYFTVEEFKLPDYELTVTVPTIISRVSGKIPVIITAEYSFGEPVNGDGTFVMDDYSGTPLNRSVAIVNGRASFEIDMQTLNIQSWGSSFQYYFTMKDSMLSTLAYTEGTCNIVPHVYTIEMAGSNFMTPATSYNYTVIMKTLDGKPPPLGTQVNVTIEPFATTQYLKTRADGTISSLYTIPANATYLSFRAISKDAQDGYLSSSSVNPGSYNYIGVTALTQNVKIDQFAKVVATVGETIDFVNYIVTAKGVILLSDRIGFPVGKRQTTISFKVTFAFIPYCQIIVYYVNKAGDYVVGSTDIQVRDKFSNFVKLNFTDIEVKPGSNHTFTVESKCDSTVSFRAIDHRVFLSIKNNQQYYYNQNPMEKNKIFDQLQRFQWEDWKIYENRPYSQIDGQFNGLGCIVFTNTPSKFDYYGNRLNSASAVGSSGSDVPVIDASTGIQIRKDFTETFCWTDAVTQTATTTATCTAKVSCRIPDSMSKYLIYSVAMNTKSGIGVSDIPANVTAFLPFFFTMDIPYSIQRNEILILDLNFFNSLTQNQSVVITIPKATGLPFEGVDLVTYGWTDSATGYTKTFAARASTNFKVQFAIRFKAFGIFAIKVTAKAPLAGDAVEKTLRVIPEGIPRVSTSSVFINLDADHASEIASLKCNYPNGTYEDTKAVELTIVGDILGKALKNLENLIRMPTGCGEQILSGLAPDLAIHEYLLAVGKLTEELETRLIQYEQAGIQNILGIRRQDGGFLFFSGDTSSSTWLTAYIIKVFFDARLYVQVDMDIIQAGIDFIMTKQDTDGKFIESATVYSQMQGGVGKGIAMTAYVSIVLNSLLAYYPQYQDQYLNSINYLAAQEANVTNVYELGVISYALKLAGKEPEATNSFNRFNALRQETATTIQWIVNVLPSYYINQYNPSALDIEISAYGLKLLLEFGEFDDAIKVAKYLISQQNEWGGFGSTQDTVVALQALSLFAQIFSTNFEIQLALTPNLGSSFNLNIDSTNALTLYQYALNQNTTQVGVSATTTSSGYAVVSLICSFYQDPTKFIQSFNISHQYEVQCKYAFRMNVCVNYIPTGTSNMAIVRVKYPSGFRYSGYVNDPNNIIRKTEDTDQGSSVTFYFASFGNQQTCFKINGYRYNYVTNLKGGTIIVNDYYDTLKEGTAKFDVSEASLLTRRC